jgi:hypothetical protein
MAKPNSMLRQILAPTSSAVAGIRGSATSRLVLARPLPLHQLTRCGDGVGVQVDCALSLLNREWVRCSRNRCSHARFTQVGEPVLRGEGGERGAQFHVRLRPWWLALGHRGRTSEVAVAESVCGGHRDPRVGVTKPAVVALDDRVGARLGPAGAIADRGCPGTSILSKALRLLGASSGEG